MASTQILIFCNVFSASISVMLVLGTVTMAAGGPARRGWARHILSHNYSQAFELLRPVEPSFVEC